MKTIALQLGLLDWLKLYFTVHQTQLCFPGNPDKHSASFPETVAVK